MELGDWNRGLPRNFDYAYLAGLFDGEGCVLITKTGSLQIAIINTDRAVLEWVAKLFPAPITERPKYKEHHKQSYQFFLCGDRAVVFLAAIFPFLKIKQNRVAVALEYHRGRRRAFGQADRLTDEEWKYRKTYKDTITKLNDRRGVRV